MSDNFSFFAGLALIVLNPLVGYGGIIYFAFKYKKNKNKLFLFLSGFFYVLSWGMLIWGALLAGSKGLEIAKAFVRENILFTVLVAALIVVAWIIHRKRTKRKNEENKGQQQIS